MNPTASPRGDNMRQILAVSFVLALVMYVGCFWWIQHERSVKGPWVIVFAADAQGSPSLQISQVKLRISEKLIFPDDRITRTNFSERIVFSEAMTNLPFGEMLLQDELYLPGSVTLRVAGHQIEILPRVLILDKKESPWQMGHEIALRKTAPPEQN
jgi:hypothetical protein